MSATVPITPSPRQDRFESLLGDLSATFAEIPADQIDSQIESALRQIVETLQIDRSGFGEALPDGSYRITHSYEVPGVPPSPRVIVDRDLPWYATQVRRGDTVRLVRLPDDLPPEAVQEREYCLQSGLKCELLIPLKIMGSVVGAIAFDSFHSYGNWSEELVGRLRLIGDIFTHVLVRKRIDRALKQAEEEARRFRDELARATRIELASQLTTSIAHEVNQPLCAIASNAQTALDLLELGDTQELKQTLHDIYGDARRASEVIACIRNMIKKGEPKRASHDLGSLVGEIEPILRRESAARGVKLSIDVEANQSRVVCDRVQIQQVVLNLVLNAVEAVSTANVARTEVHIRVGSQPDGAHLRVEDSAVGLSPEVCERIFAPFFTTKAVGLGMGLTISRSIITAHGGRIWATPGSRSGTIVQFQLPGA